LGRKRSGKGKYFLFCIAGLTFFSLLSCAPIYLEKERPIVLEEEKPVAAEKGNCTHLDVLESLARHEDFETLLKKYQDMLEDLHKDKSADELLFTLGLLYAHPENPKKNYQKSLAFFKKMIKEYPRSAYVVEAKIWAGVLEDIENAAKVDLEIEQKKKELGK
jgi:TolA-binding protein